jgi:hypothetical protein
MPDDMRRAWFRAHKESIEEIARARPPSA